MPEISFCFFDLKFLFRLFPKTDSDIRCEFAEYEQKAEQAMAQNRERLFT